MKKKIILKAINLFFSLGFKSVTMDDLAQSMSISKKTIYQFFKNKNQLISSCTESIQKQLVETFKEIRKNADNPIVELFEIKKEAMKIIGNTETALQFQLQKFYPEIYEEIKNREFNLFKDNIQKSLKRGIKSEYFRKEINIDFVTRIYLNGMRGVRDINLFPLNEFKVDEVIEDFIEYHLRAISTKKGLSLLNKIYKKSEL
ncbi:MAG: TetR family transcriptional regulator [Flavobacteriales bacterium]|mgnify:FL=1|jgi:AcrR family transcriptional regulator|nr:TetR family transcriptional regulator [Flavobacteriales bacterium]|tara:strand:+ start:657 stop:1262 length:606 start_codon:yes stop_codon:yes gene_type:complete